jgi:hypothetical protein
MFFSLDIVNDGYNFNFYITVFSDRVTDFDHGTGWACGCEILVSDGGNFVVFADVRDKELGLNDIIYAGAGCFEHLLDAFEDETGLGREIAGGDRRAIVIQRELAGYKHHRFWAEIDFHAL